MLMTERRELIRDLAKFVEQKGHNCRSGGVAVSAAKDAGKSKPFVEFELILKLCIRKAAFDSGAFLHWIDAASLPAAK